ncbi:c-type cytochrome [Desulfocurvus sp.]|jgi:cytochrome c|uniref:c-type cytochrome n=1 Tax=Desulfocurvus sp. TaxID=2871698 RepID=UPI0025BB1A88|nr:c-type cytochrome [Desulfocurvus sp.]MCK9240473.1 c-type cytochrome [Desulfocurvus sp.]
MKRIIAITLSAAFATTLFAAAALADGAALYGPCKGCHGADGSKTAMNISPALKGQGADELLTKLKGYKDGTYKIQDKTAPMMAKFVKKLSDEELKTLADHIATF